MSLLNTLIKFILAVVKLLAYGASGESKYGRVPTNLMPVRLQFHGAKRPLGFGGLSAQKP
jgi:hypothetical protein